jgi:AcrR family transcriptional regulator
MKNSSKKISSNIEKPSGPVKSEQGTRQIEILNAARQILIEEGYPSFTMRRIAKRANIHLKTLQHYFNTKRILLMETVNYTLDNCYFKIYEDIDSGVAKRSPKDALSWVLEFLIADCKAEDTCKFFFELWALSSRDEDACEALDALYTRHRQQIEKLLARANPTLSAKKIKLRAAVIAEQIEGLVPFIGYGKPRHPEFAGLEAEVHKRLMEYALQP